MLSYVDMQKNVAVVGGHLSLNLLSSFARYFDGLAKVLGVLLNLHNAAGYFWNLCTFLP